MKQLLILSIFIFNFFSEIHSQSHQIQDSITTKINPGMERIHILNSGKSDMSQLTSSTSINPLQGLQGAISGVTVLNSHVPGGDPYIYIRGVGSLSNSNVLYIIDNVPYQSGISFLNKNDIEEIEVLKDGSASFYGGMANNGVIIIKTKRGKQLKPNISFHAQYGIGKETKLYELLNTKELGELIWLQNKNEGRTNYNSIYGSSVVPVIPDYVAPAGAFEGNTSVNPSLYSSNPQSWYQITKANKTGTDWQKEIFRPASLQDYHLSFSSENKNGNLYFGTGYSKEDGVLKYTGMKRYTFRLNGELNISKWLKMGESLGFSSSEYNGNMDDGSEKSPILSAIRMPSIFPVYDINGNFAGTRGTNFNVENPVSILSRAKNNYFKRIDGIGNIYAEVKLLKKLKLRTSYGFVLDHERGFSKLFMNPEYTEYRSYESENNNKNYFDQKNWRNTIQFSTGIRNHHYLEFIAGFEQMDKQIEESTVSTNLKDHQMMLSSSKLNYKNRAYFGKADYIIKNKYLISATMRQDKAYVFSNNNNACLFPSISLAWIFSEEGFLKNKLSWLNYARLRTSAGKTGNAIISGFSTSTTSLGNPDVKWETTTIQDIGIDAKLLSKLSFTIEFWNKKSKNILYGSNPSVFNIGEIQNKGYDFSINYGNQATNNQFKYNIGINLSHYINKIEHLPDNSFISGASLKQVEYTRAINGSSFPVFYGFITKGIFQTDAEAMMYPAFSNYNKAGHYKFKDISKDGSVDFADRTTIGSPHPAYTLGFNFSASYQKFTLFTFIHSCQGNKSVNYVKRWIDYSLFEGNRSKDMLYESWGSPHTNNANANLPLADYSELSQVNSSAFVEDGSYIRLKTLRIGYHLSQNFANSEIYIQATNLFTITKYSGMDPEIAASGWNMGIDNAYWPSLRQFLIGIKIDL